MKKLLFGFKLYYLIYLLLAFNAYINERKFMSYATLVLTAGGLLVLSCMVMQAGKYKDMYHIKLNLLFILSYVLSSVCTYRYGFTDNIKECIWLLLSMVVLYAAAYCYTPEEIKKEFRVLSVVWVIYCTVVNAISISMVVWGREYGVPTYYEGVKGYKVIGFKWGRLWGLYDDPNHGATIAAVAIILALYLIRSTEKKWLKAVWVLTIPVQFVYISLSDSRTGLVTLIVITFLWTAVSMYFRDRQKGMAAKRALGIGIVTGVVLSAVVAGAVYECEQQYNVVDKKLEASWKKKNKTPQKPVVSGQVGRKKDLVYDASNGRLDIWKSGFEIAKTSPVYGVSFRNMTAYAEENLPKTYLVNNGEGVKYDSLHNAAMDILVSQGIIGIIIVLLIVFTTVRLMKRKLGSVEVQDRELMLACFTALAAMGAGSMFLSMVFYLNAPQTYIFWLCFGYFVTFLQKEGRVE